MYVMFCVSRLCGSVHTRLVFCGSVHTSRLCGSVSTHVSFVWQCEYTRLLCVAVCAHVLFSVSAQSAGATYPKEHLG